MSGTRSMYILGGAGVLLYLLVLGAILYALRPEERSPPHLTLESVAPVRGAIGKDLEVVLKGSGFDRDTRVSLTLDAGNRSAIISTFPTWGQVKDVVFTDDLLLAVTNAGRFMAIDVADPSRPALLGSLKLPAAAFKIAVKGKTAWVGMREKILAVDFSDPAHLKSLGSLDLGGTAADIVVKEDVAFVANSQLNEVESVDIRDSSHPRLLRTLKVTQPLSLAVKNNVGYIGGNGGIHIVRISPFGAMHLVKAIPLKGSIVDLDFGEEKLFAVSASTLFSFDIRELLRPVLMTSVVKTGLRKVNFHSGRIHLLGGEGLQIFAEKDLHQGHLGSIEPTNGALCFSIGRQEAFVGTAFGGIQVMRLGNNPSARLYGEHILPAPGNVQATLSEKMLFLRIGTMGLCMVTFDPPSKIHPRGMVTLPTTSTDSEPWLKTSSLYVSTIDGLFIVDTTRLDSPEVVGRIEAGSTIHGVAGTGETLFAAGEKIGLSVYDLTDPKKPRLITRMRTSRPARAVAIEGNFLYLGEKGGVSVFDVTTPERPHRVGGTALPWHMRTVSDMKQLVVQGGMLYVADGKNGLLIMDIKDPKRPIVSGSMNFFQDSVFSLSISGQIVYVSAAKTGTHVVDVSNPASPQVLTSFANRRGNALVTPAGSVLVFSPGRIRDLPAPIEIRRPRLIDSRTLAVTLPSPPLPGNYTLRVFDGSRGDQIDGAVTFAPQ